MKISQETLYDTAGIGQNGRTVQFVNHFENDQTVLHPYSERQIDLGQW